MWHFLRTFTEKLWLPRHNDREEFYSLAHCSRALSWCRRLRSTHGLVEHPALVAVDIAIVVGVEGGRDNRALS